MSEFDQRQSASTSSSRNEVEAAKGRARAEIGEATSRAKEALSEAKQTASEVYDDVRSQARGAYRQARGKVSELRRYAPNSPEAARQKVGEFVEANPALVAVAGLAAGLLVGVLLPGTRKEDELFGHYADDAKDQGLRYARDLVDQGRTYLEDSFQQAREAASEQA